MKTAALILLVLITGCAQMPAAPQVDGAHGAMAMRFSTLTTSVVYIVLMQPGSCVAQPDGVIACTVEKQ